MEAWRYRDRHLWQYEAGQRRSGLRNRRETYRRFGAELATRYETVVFEDFDLRRLVRRQTTNETYRRENATARTNGFHAAAGELRACVLNAFVGRGGTSAKVSALDSTHICHGCGSVEVFDAAAFITHVCTGCGAEWDQDENASKVLLERFRAEHQRGAAHVGANMTTAVDAAPRWVRLKRKANEKRKGESSSDRDSASPDRK